MSQIEENNQNNLDNKELVGHKENIEDERIIYFIASLLFTLPALIWMTLITYHSFTHTIIYVLMAVISCSIAPIMISRRNFSQSFMKLGDTEKISVYRHSMESLIPLSHIPFILPVIGMLKISAFYFFALIVASLAYQLLIRYIIHVARIKIGSK